MDKTAILALLNKTQLNDESKNKHFFIANSFSSRYYRSRSKRRISNTFLLQYLSDSLVTANATVDNLLEGAAVSADVDVDFSKENEPAKYLSYNVSQEILDLTSKAFKEKLDIEIEPLGTLMGKIDFSGSYPNERKFKNVLKKAGGEDFYLSLDIDMFKGGVGVGVGGVSMGGKLKPVTTINMTIVDAKGKEIQAFEIKEKTDIVVGETKSSVGAVELGAGEDPDLIKEKLMQVYSDALDVLIADYLKENKKAYK